MYTRRLMMGKKQGFTAHLISGSNGALGVKVYNYMNDNSIQETFPTWNALDTDNITISTSTMEETLSNQRIVRAVRYYNTPYFQFE